MGKINFFKRNNLDAINFIFKVQKNKLQLNDLYLKIENKNLQLPKIIVNKKNNEYLVSGKLINNQINLSGDRLYKYNNLENLNFKVKEINFSSDNNFNFIINNKLKIKNLNIYSKVNLLNLEIKNNFNLQEIFPEIKNNIFF